MLVLAGAVLTGCSAGDGAGPEDGAGPGSGPGDEPTTSRALAAVVAGHLDEQLGDPYVGTDGLEGVGGGTGRRVVATADLRFARQPGDDRDTHLVTTVGAPSGGGAPTCRRVEAEDDSFDGCADVEGGVVLWQLEQPEEDSGAVVVRVRKGGAEVAMTYLGRAVTGDPRDLDLSIGVDDMLDIARDPRVDLTTSVEAVEAGETLEWWQED